MDSLNTNRGEDGALGVYGCHPRNSLGYTQVNIILQNKLYITNIRESKTFGHELDSQTEVECYKHIRIHRYTHTYINILQFMMHLDTKQC